MSVVALAGPIHPIQEAVEAWKDKIIWVNFPEEILLGNTDEIRNYTMELLREMAPGSGYIIGINEDVRPKHFRKGIETLKNILHCYG